MESWLPLTYGIVAVMLSEAKNLTWLVVSSPYIRFFASLNMTAQELP